MECHVHIGGWAEKSNEWRRERELKRDVWGVGDQGVSL